MQTKHLFLNTAAAEAHQTPTPKLRVNIGELLRYRATVAATDMGNREFTEQSAVTSAHLALKEDWREERLFDQLDRAAARPTAARFAQPGGYQPQLA